MKENEILSALEELLMRVLNLTVEVRKLAASLSATGTGNG